MWYAKYFFEETCSLSRFAQSTTEILKLQSFESKYLSRREKKYVLRLGLALVLALVLILSLLLDLMLVLMLHVEALSLLKIFLEASVVSLVSSANPESSRLASITIDQTKFKQLEIKILLKNGDRRALYYTRF